MKKTLITFGSFFIILIIINIVLIATGTLKLDWHGFGIMIGSGLTIALFSFLYEDNPLYKLAEHFYVGVAAAYLIVIDWYNVLLPRVVLGLKEVHKDALLSSGEMAWKYASIIIPTVLGIILYATFFRKIAWVSRITFAFLMGFFSGVYIPSNINAYILEQMKSTIVPLWTSGIGIDMTATIIFIGVISTLVYFFFSVEHKGPVGWVSKLGIYFLMVAFGASFGYTVMARISLLIGRTTYLFQDWIPWIPK